jgi:hypothetical protein
MLLGLEDELEDIDEPLLSRHAGPELATGLDAQPACEVGIEEGH